MHIDIIPVKGEMSKHGKRTDTELVRELLDRTQGRTLEVVGEMVGVKQPQVSKWKGQLEDGAEISVHGSTRGRIQQALERIGELHDYDRGWRDALSWLEETIRERRKAIPGGADQEDAEDRARAVKAAGATRTGGRERKRAGEE